MAWDLHVSLEEHPTARSKAVAKRSLDPGESVLSDVALAVALLPEQKGHRCDACFRRSLTLKRCSGCAEYWYCGTGCQARHWKNTHRHMCKNIAKFRTTIDFQSSPVHGQTDAFLLSHLVAEHGNAFVGIDDLPQGSFNSPLETFASLLPLPTDLQSSLPLFCPTTLSNSISPSVIDSLFDRFSNNNFVIHSHLDPIGHGIFPLASRLFNHSCVPSAIITYLFTPECVQLTIKALTTIKAGDEITIPYFDPALPFQRRQEICRYTYGFECVCSGCAFSKSLDNLSMPPNAAQYDEVGDMLLKHVFPGLKLAWPSQPLPSSLPRVLHVVFHEDFLPRLSKTFVDAAHDGHYSIALRSGLVLFALYVVLYPPRFPQIGLHCLEMAKTTWNASVRDTTTDDKGAEELVKTAHEFLRFAMDSLSVLGKEGDDGEGPLYECEVLEEFLGSA